MDFKWILCCLVQGAPFTFPAPSDGTTPNHKVRYVGFIPDLVEALSKRLRFSYELYTVRDGKYGKYNNVTNQWNGMIADVMCKDV